MAQSATTSGNAAESPNTNKEVERFVSIDFNDVDINVFIKFISELTGKNFVVDKRVKGKVTIISPTKISVKEAYKVFESVLEVNGYATVKTDKIIKIIPAPDARSKNIETRFKDELTSPEDKIVTQIISLTYADSDEIKRLFAPMISKSSVILSYPPTNMLIVTDVYSNITRLVRILKLIDITGIGQEISVIPIEFSDATKLVKILSSIFKTTVKTKKKDPGKVVTFVADERTNTIVLLASENDTVRIKKLVKLLDREVPRGKEKIRVYYLENATAEDLAKVLQELPAKKQSPAKGKKEAPLISGDVIIKADKATNSLIIMAEKDDYLVIEEIIKKLDIPRAMVYIECLIMEVNVNKEFNLGTEWQAGGKTDYDGQSKTGFFGGGFSGGGEDDYSYIKGMTGTGSLPSGFSLGVFGENVTIEGITFPNLAAVIQAHKKDKDVHILSTPQILTTDNEEASITVGKNIPYQTKSAAEGVTETYSSYEYKDVGITLKITPQISKDRMVRLNISQEVTKLESSSGEFRPTTLKRTIDTTVIVKDKNTVVIGGLIDDSFSNIEYMVPCLGNIPVLGWAFKSMSKSNDKTNLFIFLTPHVVKNPAEADMVYKKKKDQIDKIKEGNIKMYKKKKDKSDSKKLKPSG
ncbi:MAG: type II secretion system secretin GspD [Desulfobacterales bacterium]|jgi:general secretion pathway protein D|nr:type II secretion system secretin GspD [Desulfobacterales bacterium]